jgi:hypothetical protein
MLTRDTTYLNSLENRDDVATIPGHPGTGIASWGHCRGVNECRDAHASPMIARPNPTQLTIIIILQKLGLTTDDRA